MSSSILTGTVRHRRVRPREHAFDYQMWHLLLDVDELEQLDAEVAGFTYNRPGVASFHDTDHLGDAVLPIREKLRRFLAGRGVGLPAGRVLLQTSPRVLGYTFNPVSWFWCHDQGGELALVVAEVDNTFGDTHCYVLDDLEWTGEHTVVAHDKKVFHVSPFLPVDGLDYRFVLRPPSAGQVLPGERVAVHMDVSDGDGHLFDATVGQTRQALTTRSLWRQLLRMPWVTLKTIVAIHWEALFIWRRKADFHTRPEPPATGFDAIDRPDRPAPDPTSVSGPAPSHRQADHGLSDHATDRADAGAQRHGAAER